ncbi:MAG TPA: helix-turn-helix transcriptional regulator [Polyangiaceae bacterium]|nr:helix-turn-helix transcriptional regulator [Polyangiaceae bacterium]
MSDGRTLVDGAQLWTSGVQARLYPVPFPVAEAIVLQLRPGAAGALRLSARAMTNHLMDFAQSSVSWGTELTARVADEVSTEARVKLLCELLVREFHKGDPAGQMTRRASAFAEVCRTHERTSKLARRIGYSERQLRRVFLDLFGLNPKELSRVLRINAVLHALDVYSWGDAAARYGYHDQSHLIHEFRALIGETPEAFVKSLAAPHLLGGAVVISPGGHSTGPRD